MKATNEQKQLCRMYGLKIKKDATFEEAAKKIATAKKQHEDQRKSNVPSDLEGSGMFDRWLED